MKVTLGQYVETHLSREIWRGRTVELALNALKRAEDHFDAARPLTAIRRDEVEAFVVKQSKTFCRKHRSDDLPAFPNADALRSG